MEGRLYFGILTGFINIRTNKNWNNRSFPNDNKIMTPPSPQLSAKTFIDLPN